MGIFDRIKSAIWGSAQASEAPPSTQANSASSVGSATDSPKPITKSTATATVTSVDIAAVLDDAVKKSGQKLNWKTSIVDLMKALGLDSSLANRKELAKELGYTGDMNDSASMNMWLHKQVIQKLKENGGKVPSDLL
jgi:Domain of unknown function (DUF3597).